MSGEDSLQFIPEGFVGPIRLGPLAHCGAADPGVLIDGWDWGEKKFTAGGVITVEQAESIVAYLQAMILKAKAAPPLINRERVYNPLPKLNEIIPSYRG